MQTVRNNLATIVALCVVVLVLLGAFAWTSASAGGVGGAGLVAVVHDGDGGVRRLPLNADATLEVSTSLGRNVIEVENGSVRIVEADCPKGSCMRQRALSVPGQQLVCLPHRLWVEVVAHDGEAGSQLDAEAVSYAEDDAAAADLVAR